MQTDFKPSPGLWVSARIAAAEDAEVIQDAIEKASTALRKIRKAPSFICTLAVIIDEWETDTGTDPDELQWHLVNLMSKRMAIKEMLERGEKNENEGMGD